MPPFRLFSDFQPAGDQPKAIEELTASIDAGNRFQTLLGITGSGKSATIAWTMSPSAESFTMAIFTEALIG